MVSCAQDVGKQESFSRKKISPTLPPACKQKLTGFSQEFWYFSHFQHTTKETGEEDRNRCQTASFSLLGIDASPSASPPFTWKVTSSNFLMPVCHPPHPHSSMQKKALSILCNIQILAVLLTHRRGEFSLQRDHISGNEENFSCAIYKAYSSLFRKCFIDQGRMSYGVHILFLRHIPQVQISINTDLHT